MGTATSEVNPNSSYFNSKGMWVTYALLVTGFHFVLLTFPFLSTAMAWTLTNCIHNIVMFLLLHVHKGTPFETSDQGKARYLTHWEQIDHGEQFTSSKKFLTIVPIVLFFLASFYTKYSTGHFIVNAITLCFVLVPKLPQMNKVRLFGMNKY